MNKIKTKEELRVMRKQMGVPFMSYFKKVMNELKMAEQITKTCFRLQFNYNFLVNKSQNFRIANVATVVSRLLLTVYV